MTTVPPLLARASAPALQVAVSQPIEPFEEEKQETTCLQTASETLNATVIMVAAFVVCWTPYYAMTMVCVGVLRQLQNTIVDTLHRHGPFNRKTNSQRISAYLCQRLSVLLCVVQHSYKSVGFYNFLSV